MSQDEQFNQIREDVLETMKRHEQVRGKYAGLFLDITCILDEYEEEKEDFDIIEGMIESKVESLGHPTENAYPEHPVEVELIKYLMEAVNEHLGIGIDVVERYVLQNKDNK